MNKLLNELTASVLLYPTVSTGASAGATFYDMAKYRNAKVEVVAHRLPDDKGTGSVVLQVYEHTQSTWAGVATAVTTSVATGTITSGSDVIVQVELKAEEMSVNNSKRYLGAYITLPTGAYVASTIERWAPRFEPQD